MKKNLLFGMLLLVSAAVMAQDPVITFKEMEHDFGKIHEEDGRVSYIFQFTNEGMEPFELSNVKASCGCTTPKWTREPIEPGKTGDITVTYNPNGRPGSFTKTITVTVKGKDETKTTQKKLYIRGEVIPRQAQPVIRYGVKMGDLSLKSKEISFGRIEKGAQRTATLEYTNLTDHEIGVDLAFANNYDFITAMVSLGTLKPKEVGNLNVLFNSQICPVWGEQKYSVYFVVNGVKQLTDEYRVSITADVEEDFSKLTAEQLQESPIATIEHSIDLGTVAAGQKLAKKVQLKNAGVNPLVIRRVIAPKELKVATSKLTVKSGKTADLKIEIPDSKSLSAGSYSRQIEVITNDPKNSHIKISVKWKVE